MSFARQNPTSPHAYQLALVADLFAQPARLQEYLDPPGFADLACARDDLRDPHQMLPLSLQLLLSW